jgi:proteic killer suppression protein
MIRSFADRDTGELFDGYPVRKFQSVERSAFKKLRILHAALRLSDLRLPSLRLEKLAGDRKGQHSIRVNDRYRICFDWREDGGYEVEIVDYH